MVVNVHNLLRIYHIHMLKIIPARCPSTKRALISPDSCSGTSVMCCLQGCTPPRLTLFYRCLLCARRPGDSGVSMSTNSGLSTRVAAVSDSDVCAWTLGRGGLQSVCIKRRVDVGRVTLVQGTCNPLPLVQSSFEVFFLI